MAFTNLGAQQNIISPAEFISISKTWVCNKAGIYRVSAMGAGGSGAAFFRSTGNGLAASGGGGGGFCEKELYLALNTELTIVIGAGGASVSTSSEGGYDGYDGGATTVVGNGINLSAGGGGKGLYAYAGTVTRAGGAGGVATGGDINFSGGAGGSAFAHNSNFVANAGGGGAPGTPYGVGGRGGNSSALAVGSSAGGGGGIGGNRGGDVTVAGNYGGGGSIRSVGLGDSATSLGGSNSLGTSSLSIDGVTRSPVYGFETLINPLRSLTGGASSGGSASAPGLGAGSGGTLNSATSYIPFLGGGGGAANGGALTISASLIAFGGGSGGSASKLTGPATTYRGGNGLVVIERIG